MFNWKPLLRAHYKQSTGFHVWEEMSSYADIPDTFVKEIVIQKDGKEVCRLQQGVGHCCGANFLMKMQHVAPFFNELVGFLTSKIQSIEDFQLKWRLQPKIFFYLSDETLGWDAPIRKHTKVKELYSFNNMATKVYSGSTVTLFVLEL